MRWWKPLTVSVLAAAALVVAPTSLQAQERITCESQNDRVRDCNVRDLDQRSVRLVRQLSQSQCVKDRTWGTDSGRIWVSGGCRATFEYRTRYGGGNDRGRSEIECASRNDQRRTCSINRLDESSVRIERQLSSSACVRGRTWGTGRDQIWVTSGCRGRFSYTTGGSSGGSGWGGSDNSGRSTLRCESRSGDLQNCRVNNLNQQSVRLERRLSSAACVNGRTWGTMPNVIWVESGCRAEFSYTTGRGSGGNNNNDGRHRITCQSRNGDLQNCRVNGLIENSVRLERRLSSTACVNGRTWGTMPNIIWVESGCRAEFSYRRR